VVKAEFDLVADCGHFSMLDQPEVVNAGIERLHERTKKLIVIQSSDFEQTASAEDVDGRATKAAAPKSIPL
jgi:hypothetical protein